MEQATRALPNVTYLDQQPRAVDSRDELLEGLLASPKSIDPKWFYDEAGSALFEEITRLPEYYPTRTEVDILSTHREAIARCCGRDCVLIEPGSGSSEKVRLFLDTLRPAAYVPVDISAEFLFESAAQLGVEYPWLHIQAVCADFNGDWTFIDALPAGRRVVFYPGSTIGNLEPADAESFLRRIRRLIDTDGGLLIGVDLHKSGDRLHDAYNDSKGVTARFNLNVLQRINTELDAEFDETMFSHRAFYNGDARRVEMHLVSDVEQSVRCDGERIAFREGESIHTENSYKYTVESFSELANRAGLALRESWFDEEQLFSVHYLTAED